jgi:hypothetical protein
VVPTPEVLIAALLSVTGTLVSSHIVALFNWQAYRVTPLSSFLTVVNSHHVAWDCHINILHLYNCIRSIYTTSQYIITVSDTIHHDIGTVMYLHLHLTLRHDAHRPPRLTDLNLGRRSRRPGPQ